MRGRVRKFLFIIACSIYLCQPVYAKESADAEQTQAQKVEQEKQNTEIKDEKVPLGLDSVATFERYKRDVVVMIVFGSLLVLTTIGATVKEKYERDKSN